jgi:hypothetical protein
MQIKYVADSSYYRERVLLIGSGLEGGCKNE